MTAKTSQPVWFITGCSTGFGRELVKLILSKGWNAVITARHTDQVKDLAEGHEANALIVKLDVTDKHLIKTAVEKAEDKFGRIDVLVNNAGYGYFTSIEEGEDDKIKAQFDTNFFGLVHLTQAVLPIMRKQKSGTIVNFSSIGGLRAFTSTGYYHATKFALEGLSESLSQEVAPLGIKVLIVEPGPFRTDWAGRSRIETPVKIDDYKDTVGKRMDASKQGSGKQIGDPVRGCAAIIEAVEAGTPHLRLLLGKMAYDMANEKLDMQRENYKAWEELSISADFPDDEK